MLMNFESIEFKLYRPFTSLSSASSASSSFDNDEVRSDGYPSCSKQRVFRKENEPQVHPKKQQTR